MREAFFIDLDTPYPERAISYLLAQGMVSQSLQRRMESYMFAQDILRSYVGRSMARYREAIRQGKPYGQIEVKENAYGKPEIASSECHFNISHSGRWLLYMEAGSELGVDIEETINPEESLWQQVLAPEERRQFLSLDSPKERSLSFTQFWTFKEAYVKCLGYGLQIEPRDICFNLQGQSLDNPELTCRPLEGPEGYCSACCSLDQTLVKVEVWDIAHFFQLITQNLRSTRLLAKYTF